MLTFQLNAVWDLPASADPGAAVAPPVRNLVRQCWLLRWMGRIPVATYRLQLHKDFGFDAAAEIADYLHQLGISHVYSSPYLQAAPGSTHGYDVVDHHSVNEELGGQRAHDAFCKRLGECELGQVLDIVPNHMAISGRRNRYWWDVLENGPSSRYSTFFDIDWEPHEEKLRNKLLVPILGDHYGRVLSRGELKIKRNAGEFTVQYFDQELPVAPKALPLVLAPAAREAGSDLLAFLADSLDHLPGPTMTDEKNLGERHRNKEMVRRLLERLLAEVPFIGDAVDMVLREINGSPEKMDQFLERQNYRLAYWQTAQQDLGYRRFFDVNTLVGLRVEDPRVFADTHALILRWLSEGVLDGIRIDHPDGLRDPRQYFERLRKEASDVWIVGEKIIEPGERFRKEWPINGTTGYEYLNEVNGLFVDGESEAELTRFYADFTGQPTDYSAVCRDKKQLVLRDLLGSDVNRLTTLFLEVCESNRDRRDYTRRDAMHAIRALAACFPVYRTYVVPAKDEISEDDERYINEAVECAKQSEPAVDPDLFDFLRNIMLLRVRGSKESEFVMRFQQFCSPVMAKGVEDTVFYNYNRLLSLNEVGGDPGKFGRSPEQFHEFCADIQANRPQTMLSSSTHDTKRSEDVRARINLLSEIPAQWKAAVCKWSLANERFKTNSFPDRNTEYLIYQTLVGAWPIDKERMLGYVEKAVREAKQQTSWLSPNEQFEKATVDFIGKLYESSEFQRSLQEFVEALIAPFQVNALAQLLLKMTSPGIPDLYQGSELWDFSLVDPDNRRPVDYGKRRELLRELASLTPGDVLKRSDEGLPKLWVVYHALRVRREMAGSFGEAGHYKPLEGIGAAAPHIVAYMRGDNVLVAVPRLSLKLKNDWSDTQLTLPDGRWKEIFSGKVFKGGATEVSQLFEAFPVALLVGQ